MDRQRVAAVIAKRIRACRDGAMRTQGPGRDYWREREHELRTVMRELELWIEVGDELYLMERGPA